MGGWTVKAPEQIVALQAKVVDLLTVELGDSYDCTRVWSAWGYGTMGEDDFEPVLDRIDAIASDIVRAILKEQDDAK